ISSFLSHQLCAVSCGTNHLSDFSRMQLNVVDLCTYRDLGKRQAVSYSYLSFWSVHNLHSVGQSFRSQDVCLFPVFVADQCNVCCSVRIILDSQNCCADSIFSSLEINNSIFLLSSASAVSNSNFSLVVTSCLSGLGSQQRLLRRFLCDFREIRSGHLSSGRCIWAVCFNSHDCSPFKC